MLEPKHLDGIAALMAAQSTKLRKQKGERDTEFVKRIVCAYLNADATLKVTSSIAMANADQEESDRKDRVIVTLWDAYKRAAGVTNAEVEMLVSKL